MAIFSYKRSIADFPTPLRSSGWLKGAERRGLRKAAVFEIDFLETVSEGKRKEMSRHIRSVLCVALVVTWVGKVQGSGRFRSAGPTPTPSPTPAAILDYDVFRLAVDPLRPRVYATVPSANSVIVIDTNSLTVTQTIPIGSSPRGLAVSADGTKLWVANSGSTTAGIGIIDLETLTTLPSFPTPRQPFDIREGLGHRLYASPAVQSTGPNGEGTLMQIDGKTGAFQKWFGGFEVYQKSLLELTTNRRILIFGNTGISPSTLILYDVSSDTPVATQQNSFGSYGQAIRLRHDDRSFVFPNGGGNSHGYATDDVPLSDIHAVNGFYDVGAYTAPPVYSNDDSLLYHGTSSQNVVKIFNTQTFAQVGTITLGNSYYPYTVVDLVVDRTGAWLFVAVESYSVPNQLRIFPTGRSDPLPPPRLANISTRAAVGVGDGVVIGGFIITGSQPKRVIVRAVGPSLAQAGVSGALADPTIELHDGAGATIATNDNWQTTVIGGVITSDQVADISASGVAPTANLESAIIATLSPGAYTAVVSGRSATSGVGLVEVYDLNRSVPSKLANISTRGLVQTGDNVLIGGTIVTGSASARVLIRAIGPSLAAAGVANSLQDPTLEIRDFNGALVVSNDNWRDSQEAEIQSTGVAPTDDRESAILTSVTPDVHTAIVRGRNGTVGVGLVEIYQISN